MVDTLVQNKVDEVVAKGEVAKTFVEQQVESKIASIENPTFIGWIKNFFKRSETILLARIEVLVGFIIAACGAIDFSPLYQLFGETAGFTSKQVMWLGGASIFKGLLTELARRRNGTLV